MCLNNIYNIYIKREIVAFDVFEGQTIEVFSWCSFSILFNFSASEAFAGEALVRGEINFFYSLVLSMDNRPLLSPKPKNICFCRGFLWE